MVIKGAREYLQINLNATENTTTISQSLHANNDIELLIIVGAILISLFMLLFFGCIFYYIYRKYKSIDNHTNSKYNKPSHKNTYKKDNKEYNKSISELGAKTLPSCKTVVNGIAKIIELKRKSEDLHLNNDDN